MANCGTLKEALQGQLFHMQANLNKIALPRRCQVPCDLRSIQILKEKR